MHQRKVHSKRLLFRPDFFFLSLMKKREKSFTAQSMPYICNEGVKFQVSVCPAELSEWKPGTAVAQTEIQYVVSIRSINRTPFCVRTENSLSTGKPTEVLYFMKTQVWQQNKRRTRTTCSSWQYFPSWMIPMVCINSKAKFFPAVLIGKLLVFELLSSSYWSWWTFLLPTVRNPP